MLIEDLKNLKYKNLQGIAFNKPHNNTVAVEINWFRHRKPSVVQDFHVSKFSSGWKPWQIKPWSSISVLVVVSFFFNFFEMRFFLIWLWGKIFLKCILSNLIMLPVNFQTQLSLIFSTHNVNIWFLTNTNLVPKRMNNISSD